MIDGGHLDGHPDGHPTQPDREPLAERFPRLADVDRMDDEQRIAAFRDVLDGLRRELDDIGK